MYAFQADNEAAFADVAGQGDRCPDCRQRGQRTTVYAFQADNEAAFADVTGQVTAVQTAVNEVNATVYAFQADNEDAQAALWEELADLNATVYAFKAACVRRR